MNMAKAKTLKEALAPAQARLDAAEEELRKARLEVEAEVVAFEQAEKAASDAAKEALRAAEVAATEAQGK